MYQFPWIQYIWAYDRMCVFHLKASQQKGGYVSCGVCLGLLPEIGAM